jgi:hypothetical protein
MMMSERWRSMTAADAIQTDRHHRQRSTQGWTTAIRITQVAAARIGQGSGATQAVAEAVVDLRTLRARLLRMSKSVITRKERRSILCD